MAVKRDPNLRAFVKVDKLGQVVPGTLILRRKPPESGRSHNWIEIESNICCSQPLSEFDYALNSGTGLFTISVNGSLVTSATNTQSGTYTSAAGDTVLISVTGTGPQKTLLVVDDTTGVVLSNQVGTTGALTYTYIAPGGHAYSVIAAQNLTTTTTTTTTSTSTTTTSTTSTSTTTTSTTSTTTTSTTVAAGAMAVVNNHVGLSGINISAVGPTPQITGGTFPVTQTNRTNATISVAGVNTDITVSLTATGGIIDNGFLSLYKNGALQETLGAITVPGTYTFGPISFLTSDNLEVVLT